MLLAVQVLINLPTAKTIYWLMAILCCLPCTAACINEIKNGLMLIERTVAYPVHLLPPTEFIVTILVKLGFKICLFFMAKIMNCVKNIIVIVFHFFVFFFIIS